MKVTFACGLKDVGTKMFVSGDLGTKIIIEKDALDPHTLAKLNAMLYSEKNKSQELTISIDDGQGDD